MARLADRYAGDLPGIQQRAAVRVPAVVHAVCGHQARRLFKTSRLLADTQGPAEVTDDRAAPGGNPEAPGPLTPKTVPLWAPPAT